MPFGCSKIRTRDCGVTVADVSVFPNAVLGGQQLKRLVCPAVPEGQDNLFQFRILLPVEAVQVGGFETGFLQFLEDASGFDTQVLAHFARIGIVISNQQHVILRFKCVEKRAHLPGRSETGFVEKIKSVRVYGAILAAGTNQMQLQGLGGDAFLPQASRALPVGARPFTRKPCCSEIWRKMPAVVDFALPAVPWSATT